MTSMPTPKATVLRDGSAHLYRFRPPEGEPSPAAGARGRALPILLVPSLINRWYVLDLRRGVSLADALVRDGRDVFCLDWGAPDDEDRYLSWEDVLARLGRAVRRVRKITGAPKVGVLGYCMGATLTGIWSALHPEQVAAFVNLAGPFDFSHAGPLGHMTRPRWFDVDAIADAGNVHPLQMQSGFVALRPTQQIAKWVSLVEKRHDREFREAFESLEGWANDNVSFPAAAYRTYIRELYQENRLIKGEHHVGGRRVDLRAIECPVLTIAADRDTICPPPAASALNAHCGAREPELLVVPGGHVGAVIGSRAPKSLYPAIADFFRRTTCN